MARIYLSSSWLNGIQPFLVKELRKRGHIVYDFRHPHGRDDRNIWETATRDADLFDSWRAGTLVPSDFDRLLDNEDVRDRYDEYLKAISDADTCILLLPCEPSSHIVAGYMAGMCKRVFVLDVGHHIRPELMFLTFDGYFHDYESLYNALDVAIPGVCRVCGCTYENPCAHPDHGYCWWVEPSLCSHCASKEEGGLGIKDDPRTEHCINDLGKAFK